ncbi:hypothetical protein RBB79_03765 [Tunturiibacter empetritectus]|uniref:Uncharacterized protein n=1 Tax=Tunturiibacter lichenicola TaxID=2051959 RepID=A0A852VBH3_9BACT|nr:hypothetical protein [Edaphobacter lichenicola]NYF88631.1 hypothetical protein [Edaphobacter lichenicola]
MLSTRDEAKDLLGSDLDAAHLLVLRGREAILRMQPVLIRLSALCEQTGAMDYLEYFLTGTDNLKKIPYLVLAGKRRDLTVTELRAEDLKGAVLVYEYKVLGMPSRVFTTSDFNGSRAVIAPPAERTRISANVGRYLMTNGAQVVMLSYSGEGDETWSACFDGSVPGDEKRLWTTQTREVGATIVLEKTVDETLAAMGKHTRRNLRYYRRKAEAELGCIFEGDVKSMLNKAQLIELNEASTHPISEDVLERRYSSMKALDGLFCVGVKRPDGQWISLLGGRRHHGVSEIDWQMNRGGLERYSVGTVIRAYLIEHEIKIGTGRLYFEGGTPHSMRHAFVSEKAVDIVVAKRSLFVSLLRRVAHWSPPKNNFLLQTLVDPALHWELH